MLLLVACATPDTPALTARAKAVSCPTGCACEADGDRDYAFCTTAASEPDAQSACEAAGMTLADVEDATENTWLWARAESHHAASNWWLGLSDVATEGTWAWESGSTSTYTNWRTGEPNDYGGAEDCVIWKDDGGGGWNDKSCADRLPYVCEAGCLYLDWFADADGDGFGDPAALARACDAPGGYVADASDCDDADATVAPTRTFYADADGDGFGSAPTEACDAPSGHVETGGDCDDADPAAYPGAPETSLDGVDQDCDGADACTWYRDADGDGHGVAGDTTEDCAGAPSGYAATADDCDDADATVSPSASEVWYDGVDQDCDGNDDDADGDGVAVSTDCDDGDASEFPDAPEACDAEDDDCDGVLDDGAPCPGTTGAYDDHAYVFVTTDASWAAAAAACDAIGYHLVELADAAEDDWVAGEAYALEGTGWWIGLSDVATEGTFVWQESAATYTDWRAGEPNDYGGNEDCGAYATSGGQWNDKDCAQALPYVCEAGCEKATWYTDADGDGYGSAATRACTQPSGTVAIAGDCDDADAGVSPLRVETCDGADEDCDGEADEDATDAPTWYLDADGDGYGTDALAACSQPDGYAAAGDDCDDGDPVVYPGAPELDDGLDDDCDGDVEFWDADGDGADDFGDDPDPDDADTDDDGLLDGEEGAGDTDGDGASDREDPDDDGDGLTTWWEGDGDTDGDGTPDHLDLDADDDGVPDADEGTVDTDGDGLANARDADDDDDGIPTAEEPGDTDGDGIPDALEVAGEGEVADTGDTADEPASPRARRDDRACGCGGGGATGAWVLAAAALLRRNAPLPRRGRGWPKAG